MFKKLFFIALIFATQAHASFVETDWKSSGDKQATLDSSTGLEWLKFPNTAGMSLNQVLAATSVGGSLEGWRIPTSLELQTWWQHVLNGSSSSTLAQGAFYDFSYYADAAKLWFQLNGIESSSPTRSYGMGYASDGDFALFGISRTTTNTRYWVGYGAYGADDSSIYNGVFLVSDGGLTLSSIQNPSLNINNPSAPINNPAVTPPVEETPAEDVAAFGLAWIVSIGLCRRRRATSPKKTCNHK